jgi:hypothetical protein
MKPRRLLTTGDAVLIKKQHKSPCSDCPWRRKSLPGWLGDTSVGRFLWIAHGDGRMECHTKYLAKGYAECAGAAIYKANVCKSVNPPNLELLPNRATVFAQPLEFAIHHSKGEINSPVQLQELFSEEANSIRKELKNGRGI